MRVTFINHRRRFLCLLFFLGFLVSFLLVASLLSPVWAIELNPDVLDQLKPKTPLHDQIKLVTIKAPNNLTAASETQGVISLRWNDQSDNEHGFIVERRGEINDFAQVAVVSRNTYGYTDSESSTYPIFPGETYYYRVKAFNDTDESAYSNIVEIVALKKVPPIAPVITRAEIKGSSWNNPVELRWEDRSNDETRFEVQRRREGHGYFVVADLPPNTTEYEDKFDYEDGVTYYYRIKAFNAFGSSYSNEIPVHYLIQNYIVPPFVTGVPQNSTSILLQWSHPAEIDIPNMVQGYDIRVGTASPQPYEVVGPEVTELLITGLEPETSYRIGVAAVIDSQGSFSTVTQVRTGPRAPLQVKAVKKGDTSVELTWQSSSIYHPSLDYEIQFRDEQSSFTTITRLTQPETLRYLVTGLDPNKNYAFRVIAYYVVYASDPSEVVVPTEETSSGLPISPAQVEIVLNVGQQAYSVNGQQMQMDAQPVIVQGRTLLPIRYITEALGAAIAWSGAEQKVTISQDEQVIELWINKNKAMINGQSVPIDAGNNQVTPLIIPPGRTMLPLRFITESLGCQLEWDADTQQITILRQ